jgi:hypothetical protein
MRLAGVRKQLEEARELLVASAKHAEEGQFDPAYRAALGSRNRLFHAARGLAAARGEELPEMPVVGVSGGKLEDHRGAVEAIDAALAVEDDDRRMVAQVEAARGPYGRYLGWLRDEVGHAMARPKGE